MKTETLSNSDVTLVYEYELRYTVYVKKKNVKGTNLEGEWWGGGGITLFGTRKNVNCNQKDREIKR